MRTIITLLSDFGTEDYYVAAMKAVLLKHCPDATLVDVTHQIARHDILSGSIALERAVACFGPGTVHLAVVDPGVGTDRKLILAQRGGERIVCPDNGLITWTVLRFPETTVRELTWRPTDPVSSTFHGRDILAPAAGRLARGTPTEMMTAHMGRPVLLDIDIAKGPHLGKVLYIDRFGNATTNMPGMLASSFKGKRVKVRGHDLGEIRRVYGDVAPGQPLALIGSSDLLEIAVNSGSAAQVLGLVKGDVVTLE